jgi:hypothetical protein
MSGEAPGEPVISPEDALRDIVVPTEESRKLESVWDTQFEDLSVKAEREFTQLAGLRAHFKHKSYWSIFLMILMAAMVIFQSLLIWKVGTGQWNFMGYDWLLPTLMIQYLVQIVGLAVFVVRSLFKNMD